LIYGLILIAGTLLDCSLVDGRDTIVSIGPIVFFVNYCLPNLAG
jgi:hypothetical protein